MWLSKLMGETPSASSDGVHRSGCHGADDGSILNAYAVSTIRSKTAGGLFRICPGLRPKSF